MQQVGDLTCRVVELILLIADVFDAGAGDVFDTGQIFVKLGLVGQTDLTANHDAVGGGKGLGGDPRFGFLADESVEDRIGNPVADLIRVPLGNGFRSESVVLTGHVVLQ